MPTPSESSLTEIAARGAVPAVGYAYATSDSTSGALAVGVKDNTTTDKQNNTVNTETQFPASSLSKVVFTYLVLQLAKFGRFDLDKPLYDILSNERLLVDGEYPDKAQKLTARHVLTHTSGLPNFGEDMSSPLRFGSTELGQGYSYSGEAIYYLQQVIEKEMNKGLDELASEFVFTPLGMTRSTFVADTEDQNLVSVHTEKGEPRPLYVGASKANAAGSLLTTSDDFAKFLRASLQEDYNISQALDDKKEDPARKCALGWHLYEHNGDVIAYQYGENPNTRAFATINVTQGTAAAFFTNCENGMSIANQIFTASELNPIGDLQAVYQQQNYPQCDEPGWRETFLGKRAEEQGDIEQARRHLIAAAEETKPKSPQSDNIPQKATKEETRLSWFNLVNPVEDTDTRVFTLPLTSFIGRFKNPYNDEIELSINNDNLIYKQFGQEIEMVRISETEFTPKKDQAFKLTLNDNQMSIEYVQGGPKKLLSKQPLISAGNTMSSKELKQSLYNTVYTTGSGANCFFQGFIHSLCYQDDAVIANMSLFPGANKLVEIFNREIPEFNVRNATDLILIAKAMHPLEREVIFGPMMRMTLNELNLSNNSGPLKLELGSIIFPPHAAAFSHAFGFTYDEYTHFQDSKGMPEHLKKDLIENAFYKVSYPVNPSIGTVSLRLKETHFEVAGLTPLQVKSHQSKVQPMVLGGDPNRPEGSGARYYEKPAPYSNCSIQGANTTFTDAVNKTVGRLKKTPGKHVSLINNSQQSSQQKNKLFMQQVRTSHTANYMRPTDASEAKKNHKVEKEKESEKQVWRP